MLSRLERHTPEWIIRAEVQILMNLASRSFRRPGKKVWRLSAGEALRTYAAYTAECMANTEADPERLYACAFRLGEGLRRMTGLRDQRDVRRLIFYLYQNIRIPMSGSLPGKITMRSCYFSAFYSQEQCKLMSNADAGIIAGLYGGGKLQFTQRITGGCRQCKAVFSEGGTRS